MFTEHPIDFDIKMARRRTETIIRLQRNVVFLSACLFFGALFSQPAHELAAKTVDVVATYMGFSDLKLVPQPPSHPDVEEVEMDSETNTGTI